MEFQPISNKELTQILKSLVQIPTENPLGRTLEIINYVISEVFREEEGFTNEIISYKKDNIELHNLISRIGHGDKKIILCGHFDVVPVGDLSKWNYPPFAAKIENGKLYGRGSADMKSGLTMLIGTLKNLSKNTSLMEKFEFVFVGTADEEGGMSGSMNLAKKKIKQNAILLIIGEPTNMNIGVAEKGVLWVDLTIQGKPAHGAMPQKGINSIECALNLIPALYDCLDKKKNMILGTSTLNIGRIEGGTVINVVAEKTNLKLDYRFIPEQDPESIIDNLSKIKGNPCSLNYKIIKKLPSLQSDFNQPLIQTLKKSSKAKLIGLPYATDAAHLIDPDDPVPFILYGPGNPEVIHSSNEYVQLEYLYKSTEFITKALLQTYLV
jgi:succinyl-diaminopimelate desuccinylase